jgi:tetratricopeptide (TPR) repeat protein
MPALYLLFLTGFAASAQNHPAMPPATEPPVALYPGLGSWTHPIGTRNPQAQKFFDQGQALLYGFNRHEALLSFRRALELDPASAMAQWGISMSLGPYLNMDMDPGVHLKEACDAAKRGVALAPAPSPQRMWLDAAAARCPDFSDPAQYVDAMKTLAAQFPDDPDAQTWYAEALMLPVRWRWYDSGGKPAPGVTEAEYVLEAVLRRFPNHPGANHFYIHAVESSPNPERAVPSAQRLMGIVPAAGHMVHMPGHIWLVLGEFNTTVDVNERAAQVDREYFAKSGVVPDYYPYYLHNLQFILYARTMQGRAADTKRAIVNIREAVKPMAQMMPEMAGVIEVTSAMSLLRVNQWDDVLAFPRPPDSSPLGAAMSHYLRALAFAATGSAKEAADERKAFEDLRPKLDRKMQWGVNEFGSVLDLAEAQLAARMESSPNAAAGDWKRAADIQDHLVYDEPPAWYYPVRESWGAALLASGDAAGAEAVFREGLRRSPKNGRMLFGLLESLKAQHKTDDAAWVQREFDAAWKGSDITLTLKNL